MAVGKGAGEGQVRGPVPPDVHVARVQPVGPVRPGLVQKMNSPRAAGQEDREQRPRMGARAERSRPARTGAGPIGGELVATEKERSSPGAQCHRSRDQDCRQRHVPDDHRDHEPDHCHRHRSEHGAKGQTLLQGQSDPGHVRDPKPGQDTAAQQDRGRADQQGQHSGAGDDYTSCDQRQRRARIEGGPLNDRAFSHLVPAEDRGMDVWAVVAVGEPDLWAPWRRARTLVPRRGREWQRGPDRIEVHE